MPFPANFRFSTHGAERRWEAGYSRADVRRALAEGEIIEEYPDTGRGESYLLLHWTTPEGRPIHVVGADKHPSNEPAYTLIVTVYDPRTEPEEWNDDFSERT